MANNDTTSEQGCGKIIDVRFPLPWLISSAVACVLAFGALFAKVDTVTTSLAKLETKIDNRDERITTILQDVALIKGENEMQAAQIKKNQADIIEIRRLMDEREKGAKH